MRVRRGLVLEHVAHHQQVEAGELALDVRGVRRGHRDVRAVDQQSADAARRPERVQQLVRALPLARQLVGLDAPAARDDEPILGILDQPVAGELVGLLPVLASALPVALPGQATVAARRSAHLAEREHQVGEREDRVGPLRLLLGTTPREYHAALRPGELPHRAHLPRDADAGQPLDVNGRHVQRGALHGFEPDGARGDVALVHQAFLDRDVQEADRQRQIGAGRGLQVMRGQARGVGAPRVHHDQRAVGALPIHPLHQRRHGVGAVGAPEQQHLGQRDVGDGKRQAAIDPERAVLARRRR